MLTYHLDSGAKIPLYEQLYRAVRQDIMSGALKGGERLPSKRKLAAHLEISQITVETAYSQLLAEGYITSRPRSGYFVHGQVQRAAAVPPLRKTAKQTAPVVKYPYDFKTNIVDTTCFPFTLWARLLRGQLTDRADHLLEAAPPQGVMALREEICRYLAEFRGISADPEQVVVGAGSEYLLNLMIQLLGRENTYALENPGYPKLSRIFHACGARIAPVPLDLSRMPSSA